MAERSDGHLHAASNACAHDNAKDGTGTGWNGTQAALPVFDYRADDC